MHDRLSAPELASIERRTQELGRHLFAHLERQRNWPWQRQWWDNRLLDWSMRDEALKVQLFRFVDVLPMLDTSDQVADHLKQYLGEVHGALPAPARAFLNVAPRTKPSRAALARAARRSAASFARRFIAGSNTREVVAAARRERERRRGFTLDILGEAVTSDVEAEGYFQAYAQLIENVAPEVNRWPHDPLADLGPEGPLPRFNLSIKLSALDSQFDAVDPAGSLERAGGRLRDLLRLAARHNGFINVDMESYDKKDLTLHIFESVLVEDEFRDTADVGIVLQCYLRDAEEDLDALIEWAGRRGTPVWVRLVKGAYWDYETVHAQAMGWPIPVYQEKWQSDACFERATRTLLQHSALLRPALGSHNVRSLAHGIAVAEHLELADRTLEIQMLYGMADGEKRALIDLGQRLRIYMPYGELIPGMAYLVRRLLENTSNDSFLRAGLSEGIPVDKLLAPPRQSETTGAVPATEQTMASSSAPSTQSKLSATFENEPPVDFAEESNRQAMTDALESVRSKLGGFYPLVIGNQEHTTESTQDSVDPSQAERVVGKVARAEQTQVDQAVSAARNAAPEWKALGARARGDYLRRAADAMSRRKFELAAWEVYECGKGWREATNDICEAIDFCRFYADAAEQLEAPQGADVPGEENRFVYMPRGVAAVIAPWNFPLAILTGMTTAALATGNTVIMKPAGQSPVIAAKFMELFIELDLPPGVLNFVPGRGSTTGAALVEHPDVALIAFTGSREVGLWINSRAAEVSAAGLPYVKKVIAEMGGKNAIIVDDDADLDEAVMGVVKSAFGYQGQKCSACSRVIVLDAVYDVFVHRLVESSRSLKVGPAEEPDTSVGPVIDRAARDKVLEYVEIGRQEGKEILAVDAGPLAEQGFYVGPHIFGDVSPEARLAQEEIFGPVLAVIRAADIDEAIRIANGTDYALTAGMFSRSPDNLDRARRELIAGNIYLNRNITGALVGRQPFGGFKMSGIGSKAGGDDYVLQFVLPKTITENTMRRGFAPAEDSAT